MVEKDNSVKVEVVPGVEVEITDTDKAVAAASEEVLKAEIEAAPNHTVEENEEEEIAEAIEKEKQSFKEKAKDKLKEELSKAKDKSFADPIIGYLLERCDEDEGLAEDVCQDHKTWSRCLDYIYSQAKKAAKNSRQCAVRNDVVFEWAEDYYHADDKEKAKTATKKEAESKAREEAAKKREEAAKTSSVSAKKNVPKKEEKKQPDKKPAEKKNTAGMTGQMSMFDFM